jgi:hypothetical protein
MRARRKSCSTLHERIATIVNNEIKQQPFQTADMLIKSVLDKTTLQRMETGRVGMAHPSSDVGQARNKRELQQRRNVLFWSMWEYRTSITCHSTWRQVTNMRARSWKYDRDAGKQVLSDTKSRVHKILHCRSSDGVKGCQGGGTWNRDANASRNILMLLMLVVLGVERPKEFTPAVSAARRQKQSTKGASISTAKSLSSAHLTEGLEVNK